MLAALRHTSDPTRNTQTRLSQAKHDHIFITGPATPPKLSSDSGDCYPRPRRVFSGRALTGPSPDQSLLAPLDFLATDQALSSYSQYLQMEDVVYERAPLEVDWIEQTASTKSKFLRKKDKTHPCQSCLKSFCTSNDLERHMKTVHRAFKEYDKYWKCPVDGCPSAEKRWPRLDNFKQHVIRMHGQQYESKVEGAYEIFCSANELLDPRQSATSLRGPLDKSGSQSQHLLTSANALDSQSEPTLSPRRNRHPPPCWGQPSPAIERHALPRKELLPAVKPRPHDLGAGNLDSRSAVSACKTPTYDLAAIGDVFRDSWGLASRDAQGSSTSPIDSKQDFDTVQRQKQPTADCEHGGLVERVSPIQSRGHEHNTHGISELNCKCHNQTSFSMPKNFAMISARSSNSMKSFRSDGERSFVGYADDYDDADESLQVLDEDEQRVANHISQSVLDLYLKLLYAGRLPWTFLAGQRTAAGNESRGSAHQAAGTETVQDSRKRPHTNQKPSTSGKAKEDAESDDGVANDAEPPSKKLKVDRGSKFFACPFNKANPFRYSHRNEQEEIYRRCGSCLLRDIPALKQHLYRTHKRPDYYCPCCYSIFSTSSDRDSHCQQRNCSVKQCPFDEKMEEEAYQKIKRKRRDASPECLWYEFFQALFPDRRLPNSAYIDDQESICHLINIFRTLGSVCAQVVYDRLHLNGGDVPLPGLTKAIVHEAYDIFAAELAEQQLHAVHNIFQSTQMPMPNYYTDSLINAEGGAAQRELSQIVSDNHPSQPYDGARSYGPSDSAVDLPSSPLDRAVNQSQQSAHQGSTLNTGIYEQDVWAPVLLTPLTDASVFGAASSNASFFTNRNRYTDTFDQAFQPSGLHNGRL